METSLLLTKHQRRRDELLRCELAALITAGQSYIALKIAGGSTLLCCHVDMDDRFLVLNHLTF